MIADGIRQRMRRLYEEDDVPAYLDHSAQTLLSEGRAAYKRMNLAKQPLITWARTRFSSPGPVTGS